MQVCVKRTCADLTCGSPEAIGTNIRKSGVFYRNNDCLGGKPDTFNRSRLDYHQGMLMQKRE